MIKRIIIVMMILMLGACSSSTESSKRVEHVMPDKLSLHEEDKNYLTNELIETVQTYEDALLLVTALGESFLEEMDKESETAGESFNAYAMGQRLGAEMAVSAIQQSLEEAIEQSDYEITDKIPMENKEEVTSGLKNVRDTYVSLFEEFQKEMTQTLDDKNDERYELGDTVTFEDEVAITVTSVEYTDERNQFSDIDPEKVLVVTYDVDNISDRTYFIGSEISLYIDGKKASTYPVQSTLESISGNRSFEGATQAFAITKEGEYELEIKPLQSRSSKAAVVTVSVDD